VQLNGKVRHRFFANAGLDAPSLLATAKSEPEIVRLLTDKRVLKEIVVPGRLVNFVFRE